MSIQFCSLKQCLLVTCRAVGFPWWLRLQLDFGWQGGFDLAIHPASGSVAEVFEYES
jgi:hypothetical protein